jgi:hypothetical protein
MRTVCTKKIKEKEMNLSVLAFLIGTRLTAADQEQLFGILHNNTALFEKLLPGSPLLAHIRKEKIWDHTLAQAYDAWLAKRG